MRLFAPETFMKSERTRRIYAYYELTHTLIDLSAALLFLVGSILFFYQNLIYAGTWCFTLGSVAFTMKPALRFVREIHLLKIGDFEDVAARYNT